MTQKQLNKILNILETKRNEAKDLWLNAKEYHLPSREYWEGQMIGLDICIQKIFDTIEEDTDNA